MAAPNSENSFGCTGWSAICNESSSELTLCNCFSGVMILLNYCMQLRSLTHYRGGAFFITSCVLMSESLISVTMSYFCKLVWNHGDVQYPSLYSMWLLGVRSSSKSLLWLTFYDRVFCFMGLCFDVTSTFLFVLYGAEIITQHLPRHQQSQERLCFCMVHIERWREWTK